MSSKWTELFTKRRPQCLLANRIPRLLDDLGLGAVVVELSNGVLLDPLSASVVVVHLSLVRMSGDGQTLILGLLLGDHSRLSVLLPLASGGTQLVASLLVRGHLLLSDLVNHLLSPVDEVVVLEEHLLVLAVLGVLLLHEQTSPHSTNVPGTSSTDIGTLVVHLLGGDSSSKGGVGVDKSVKNSVTIKVPGKNGGLGDQILVYVISVVESGQNGGSQVATPSTGLLDIVGQLGVVPRRQPLEPAGPVCILGLLPFGAKVGDLVSQVLGVVSHRGGMTVDLVEVLLALLKEVVDRLVVRSAGLIVVAPQRPQEALLVVVVVFSHCN